MINIIFGLISLVILIGIGYIVSEDKKNINWRTVILGLLGQVVLVFFVLKVPIGIKILEKIAFGFDYIFKMGMDGVSFVFGPLASEYFIFAVSVLGLVVFTSTLVSVLYFLKVIPMLVKYVGGAISKILGTSKIESMACVSNMLLGGSEAPLVLKNYLPTISRSELFVVMSSGFSSASVGILAGYQAMGFPLEYMLIAVATVPFSCLMISKMVVPGDKNATIEDVQVTGEEYDNIFQAISSGSYTGMQVAFAVGATLIGFLGIIALVNAILGVFGLSLSQILGWIFTPFAYLFRIPASEIAVFTESLGIKIGANEFVAFSSLADAMQVGEISQRTVNILTCGLTNFANFSVIGIVGAAINTLSPNRSKEVSGFGFKALLVGTVSTLITTTLVSMMLC